MYGQLTPAAANDFHLPHELSNPARCWLHVPRAGIVHQHDMLSLLRHVSAEMHAVFTNLLLPKILAEAVRLDWCYDEWLHVPTK